MSDRIGSHIVPFNFIDSGEGHRDIVKSHHRRISEEFADKYRRSGHRLVVEDEVVDHLVASHGARMTKTGGRGITNALEDEVLSAVAPEILAAEFRELRDQTFRVVLEKNRPRVVVVGHPEHSPSSRSLA
jgi:ATP-dependent Clp protease ATP-binding subunit ClpA